MGVYISGLEIPPKGKGVVVILCSSGAVYSGGQKVGTAVPVPPHGRLIDADEMRDEWLINGENEYVYDANAFLYSIDNMPTIIPAEEAVQDARDGP